jgi:hypothetical protein
MEAHHKDTPTDRQLAGLLKVERFAPSEEFRRRALWSDPAVYRDAERDPEAWVRRAGEVAALVPGVRGAPGLVDPAVRQVVHG